MPRFGQQRKEENFFNSRYTHTSVLHKEMYLEYQFSVRCTSSSQAELLRGLGSPKLETTYINKLVVGYFVKQPSSCPRPRLVTFVQFGTTFYKCVGLTPVYPQAQRRVRDVRKHLLVLERT